MPGPSISHTVFQGRSRTLLAALAATGFLVVLAALLTFPDSLFHEPIPSRDSGLFLYVGDQILDGKLPYRDIWDHKAPAIFYINALGLWIAGRATWGVWLLEVISLAVCIKTAYILFKDAFGKTTAWFASLSWTAYLILIWGGGNYTEEFALPLQFLSLLVFWKYRASSQLFPRFIIGVLTAGLTLLRPNLIGVPVTIAAIMLATTFPRRDWAYLAREALAMALGCLSILGVVAVYFALRHSLGDLWDAAFVYNFAYSSASMACRAYTISEQINRLLLSALPAIGLVAWFSLALNRPRRTPAQAPLIGFCLVNLPLEVGLAFFSGRPYFHYLVPLLPVLAVLAAFFFTSFLKLRSPNARVMKSIWRIAFIVILLWLVFMPAGYWINSLAHPDIVYDGTKAQKQATIAYIEATTTEHDTVLLWGAEVGINFLTQRDSPSRYPYQYPLFTTG